MLYSEYFKDTRILMVVGVLVLAKALVAHVMWLVLPHGSKSRDRAHKATAAFTFLAGN